MLANIVDYRPETIDFVLTEAQKEMFKDVLVICKGAKSSKEAIAVLNDKFNCLFPEGEMATRKYDAHEIQEIREEYCLKQENEAPKRKQYLEETLERIKAMKKNAEEAYNSILLEISDLAARVKKGTTDFQLPATETCRIALNGHFCFFSWVDGQMQLVKVEPIPDWDKNSLWSQEDWNRKAMMEVFGIEFPEIKKPVTVTDDENPDDLPFEDGDDDTDPDDDDNDPNDGD
jgi:hypothetical protein